MTTNFSISIKNFNLVDKTSSHFPYSKTCHNREAIIDGFQARNETGMLVHNIIVFSHAVTAAMMEE